MSTSLTLQQVQARIKYLGIYQIAGGLFILGLVIYSLAHEQALSGLGLILYLVMIGLPIFSMYCGQQTLKDTTRGLQLSRYNQAVQIIAFSLNGLSFLYAAGPSLTLGVDVTEELKALFETGLASFSFKINSDSPDLKLSINVVAIGLLLYCDYLKSQFLILTQPETRLLAPV